MILLIIALGYIILSKYKITTDEEQTKVFQTGAQQGYEQAVVQLMTEAAKCQPVPLFYENVTMNIVSVECLQQAQQLAQQEVEE